MGGFGYDVAIIGSGFGGSVAALRSAEKSYRTQSRCLAAAAPQAASNS